MEKELNYKSVGENIRQAWIRAHMTQEQLGEACLLSTSHIGHIERGTRIPSVDTLYKIANLLHVSVDYLLLGASEDVSLDSVAAALSGKDPAKVWYILNTMQVLAEKIDEL